MIFSYVPATSDYAEVFILYRFAMILNRRGFAPWVYRFVFQGDKKETALFIALSP